MSSRDLTPCVKRSRDRIMVKSPMVIITVNPPASQPMAETGCTHSTACTLENIAIVGAELEFTVSPGLRESRTQEGTHRFYRFRTPLRVC